MTEKRVASLGRLVTAAVLLCAAGPGAAAEPAYVVVPRMAAAPVVAAGDAAWPEAARIRIEQPAGNEPPAAVRLATEVSLGRTGDALFLRFACTNPAAPNFQAPARDRDAEAYEDESVEIFLDPRTGSDYLHFVVTASGSIYDGRKFDKKWDGDWTASVRPTEGGWEATVRIPFETLGGAPEPGTYWLLNICRNARGTDGQWQHSAWIAPGYHRPAGLVCFGAVDARPLFGQLHAAVANVQRFEAIAAPGGPGVGARIAASVAALQAGVADASQVPPDRFVALMSAAEDVSRTIEPSVQQAVMRAILDTPRP